MKQWKVTKLDRETASKIASRYGLPPIIATILTLRGITDEEEIRRFLTEDGEPEAPLALIDMDKAAARIRAAVETGEKICVYGDYDADGVTSTSLLYSYLETIGADVCYYIPDRETEGYGMNKEAVKKFSDEGVNLIVTVDNGISAHEEIALAASLGIDTVVTDHHMPSETLPEAVAVVDPHRSDCNVKFKDICGVGVAFKLVCAIEGEEADTEVLFDNYSDLVCIGTIGDIMPLVSDNRIFVKRGLRSINNTDRAGIAAILDEAGLSEREVSAGNVSFNIVPRINAVGRLGLSQKSVELLTTEDSELAEKIAAKLGSDNAERQRIEREILDSINKLIAKNPSLIQDRVLIIDGEGWHHGVVGIVSARIKEIYGKPCIVLSRNGDICRGSGRSVEGFDLWAAVSACGDVLGHFGGHPMAVGLSIDPENVELFRKRINEYAAKTEMPLNTLHIDCKLNPAALDVELARNLEYLEPYGTGNPTPLFGLYGVKIQRINPMSSGKHLFVTFISKATRIEARYFGCTPEEFHFKVGDIVDAAVNLEVNEYRGNESLSVIIRDIKLSDTDNTVYMHSLRNFEYFCKGEPITRDQLMDILPTRTNFADAYRYLRSNSSLGNFSVGAAVHDLGGNMTYGKLKVILEAMNDLGLIVLYEDMYRTQISVCEVKGKTELRNAAIIKALEEVYRNE